MSDSVESRQLADAEPVVEEAQPPRPGRVKLLVALSGGEEDLALVRAAHRMAERDGVRWRAVHVDNGRTTQQRRLRLEQAFALTNRLGGETHQIQGQGRAEELLDYARAQRVATLVVARPRPSGWRFWRRPLVDRLLHKAGPFDLVVVAEAGARPRFRPRRVHVPLRWREPAVAVLWTLGALLVAGALDASLELANLSVVFLVAVLASAVLAGTRAAMLSAVLGFLAFNFFFTQPRFSLVIGQREQVLTVLFFLLVAVVVGQLAGRGRQRLLALRASREQTHRLLSYSRALSAATGRDQVRDIGVSTLEQWLGVPVVFLDRQAGESELTVRSARPGDVTLDGEALAAAQWCWNHRQPSGFGTEIQGNLRWRFLPLVEQSEVLGVVGLELAVRNGGLGPDEEALIDTLVRQLVMALERTRLVGELSEVRVSEENERLRSALLSSVSHDLRTPLASIIGSASSLRELEPQLSADDRRELLDGILTESERLNRYIQNLLDMTRLGQGGLKIERDWIALDDLVASALKRLGAETGNLEVVRDWSDDLPLLHVHPALIEQALVNVIDNAVRFSPPGGRVTLHAERDAETQELVIEIGDQGPGIPPEQREAVFDMFHTGGEGDRGRYGSGLGLAICRGMLGAHGGSIRAEPGEGGEGTRIVMRLPLPEEQGAAPDAD
ncbi:ATP-binding protein [Halomonas sp. NO4]|uniref:ATP-binding protein n=1 Tax=Halomonas sp. NO4 TaxID=2484813 RepID=UPI0013D42E73|nr:ATP-binding protein [Halomonas sp. NO4]